MSRPTWLASHSSFRARATLPLIAAQSRLPPCCCPAPPLVGVLEELEELDLRVASWQLLNCSATAKAKSLPTRHAQCRYSWGVSHSRTSFSTP